MLSKSAECSERCDGVGELNGVEGLETVSLGVHGTRISNSVPLFVPDVSARMQVKSPPSLRAKPFATSRPSPSPSLCRVVESSSFENGLKRFGRNASGIPGPVSRTLITMYRNFGLNRAVSVMWPCSVNLTAFRKTQEIIFARSFSSMTIVSGTDGSTDH